MKNDSLKLFIKFDKKEIFIVVAEIDEQNNFKVIEKLILPLIGLSNNKISDIEKVTDIIQRNILVIEQKVKFTFKELILILDNFDISFLNFTGFKKLDGSQISKENITYIINSLKSCVDKFENKKKILHIFNSKYFLDKKEMDNIPIGLFGDFYSHELSFNLINKNDYKNLNNIFNTCNLKINKIISKNFIEGVNLINHNKNLETFIKIEINESNSQIFLFEKSALKFVQNFKFGSKLILKDISKVIAIKEEILKEILFNNNSLNENPKNEYLEEDFFKNQNFRKIKKKIIYEIAEARIQELAEKILSKNLNIISLLKKNIIIFLKLKDKKIFTCFEEMFISSFSSKRKYELKMLENLNIESLYESANKLVQYGWKKEAVPIVQENKSIISRFFNLLFK